MTARIHAIVNPNAGGGYSSNVWPKVKNLLSKYDLTYSITEKHGDAELFAKKAIEDGNEFIAVVGGDGKLNEVVQPCAEKDITIIPVSAGTGSDFVRNFSINREGSIQDMIDQNISVEVDMGVAESSMGKRYFANIAEAGFGAEVMKRMNSHKKKRGGGSFTSTILMELYNFKKFQCTVKSEEYEETLDASEIIIANGLYFGGGIKAAPDAAMSDGLLTVHIIRGAGRAKLLMNLRKLKNGSYIYDREAVSFHTRKLQIDGNALVEIDGEDYGKLPSSFSINPKALKVLGILEKDLETARENF